MTETRELLIDPATTLYDWGNHGIFALDRDGRLFLYNKTLWYMEKLTRLENCQSIALEETEIKRNPVLVGVGISRVQTFREARIQFDNRSLGLWELSLFQDPKIIKQCQEIRTSRMQKLQERGL